MPGPKLISTDSHVNEPADLCLERIDGAFRERAPRVVDDIPGRAPGSYLVLEGIPPIHSQCRRCPAGTWPPHVERGSPTFP